MSNKPTLLIVGAGFGGLGAAQQLCQNGGTAKFRVVLVSQSDLFTIGGLWQFVWTDRLALDQITFALQDANLPGIDVRLGVAIEKWITAEKQVVLKDGSSIRYDYIIMACGVVPDPTSIQGMDRFINICSFDTVPRQQQEAKKLLQKAKTEKVTFVLAIGDTPYKCPPAPFEVAFMLDEMLSKARVRDNVRMVISCPIDWPMPHPQSREIFTKELSRRNIEYLPLHIVSKIQGDTVHYKNDITIEASLLWTVYPIRAPDFVQNVIPTNGKGTIAVDTATCAIPNVEDSYSIGDCSSILFGEHTLPKAGEFAWKMGVRVANALAKSDSKGDLIGACVAEIGFGKGIALKSDFSDALPAFEVGESAEGGEQEKVDWVNCYLERIFGDKARTLELGPSENESRKKQRIE